MTIKKAIAGIKKYCMMTEGEIVGDDAYCFIDNNSNVLAVVHADTVAKDSHNFSVSGNVVTSIALDDRLGVWIIKDLLPEYNIMPDILITRDEEIGASTAQFFKTEKTYNWIFSFDRNRFDVVMYQYHNSDSVGLLGEYGFPVGIGSFSDICFLDHLGCVGFNFGTGYKNEHSAKCHADVSHVLAQVDLFARFYNDNADIYMPYEYTQEKYGTFLEFDFCEYCGEELTDKSVSEYDLTICLHCERMVIDMEITMQKDDYFEDDYNFNETVNYFVGKLLGKARNKKYDIGDRYIIEEDGELIGGTVIDKIEKWLVVYWDDGSTTEEMVNSYH